MLSAFSLSLLNLSVDEQETEHALSTFVDTTRQRGEQETCRAAVRKDPARLEEWADRNFIKFSQDKCNILELGETGIPAPRQAED